MSNLNQYFNATCHHCKKDINKKMNIKEDNYYFCGGTILYQDCRLLFYRDQVKNIASHNAEELTNILFNAHNGIIDSQALDRLYAFNHNIIK
jgi:hypothetical protein